MYYYIQMSDSCFMCLINTNIKQCSNCNIRAHYKCWSQYINNTETTCTSKDKNKIISCPQCRIELEIKTPNTRSKMNQDDKETVIYILKKFLNTIENIQVKEQKMSITMELFEYINKNIWFMKDNPRFKTAVKNKLCELYLSEKWDYCNKMYIKMFNKEIPLYLTKT